MKKLIALLALLLLSMPAQALKLYWWIPTYYTNGQPLPDQQIKDITIVYGRSKDQTSSIVTCKWCRSYDLTPLNLISGTWYFAVYVTTVNGESSALSEWASVVIP